jgi:outer membrane protein
MLKCAARATHLVVRGSCARRDGAPALPREVRGMRRGEEVPMRGGSHRRSSWWLLLAVPLVSCSSVLPRAFTAPAPAPDSPARPVELTPVPPARAASPATIPQRLLQPGATFTLGDVVEVALQNNPVTRTSFEQARAAAAQLGSKRAAYYPSLVLSASGSRGRVSPTGQEVATMSTWGPALDLAYLLLDLGGRAADVEEARQSLLAADWGHNATVQNVVLAVQQTYYGYLAAKAEVDAARVSLKQAGIALDAARVRHDAGVATIADVLQAQTAVSQARLDLDTVEGQVMVVRGSLATAMGLPANVPLEVGELPAQLPLQVVDQAVDALIETARLQRPDLEAARALEDKASAHVRSVRAEGLPVLSLGAGVSRTYFNPHPFASARDNWSAQLLLSFPLFTGYSSTHNIEKARRDANAAVQQTASLDQQVVLEVWSSYYNVQTAAQRVKTTKDLLASAEQSERVQLGRYEEGVGTILDLLSAELALANARAQEILARSDWLIALAQLIHDTGARPNLQQTVTVQTPGARP